MGGSRASTFLEDEGSGMGGSRNAATYLLGWSYTDKKSPRNNPKLISIIHNGAGGLSSTDIS